MQPQASHPFPERRLEVMKDKVWKLLWHGAQAGDVVAHDNICQCEEGSGTVGQVTDNQSIRVTSVGEEVRGISVSCSSHVSVHMCMMRTDFFVKLHIVRGK